MGKKFCKDDNKNKKIVLIRCTGNLEYQFIIFLKKEKQSDLLSRNTPKFKGFNKK